ncbi:hypothetical protein ABTM02_20745, partial [Acinetobacter baumannii]
RDSHNRQFAGLPLVGNMLKYMLFRRGVMALGSYEVGAFAKVMPNATRPDVQLMFAPFSLDLDNPAMAFTQAPGLQFFG